MMRAALAGALLTLLAASASLPAQEPSPPPRAPDSPAQQIIDVTDKRPITRNDVTWLEGQYSGSESDRCGRQRAKCLERRIDVRNPSRDILRCAGRIRYQQPNAHGIDDIERTTMVPPGKTWTVVRSDAPRELTPVAMESDCRLEPPPPPFEKPEHCKISVDQSVDMNDYYPKAAKREWREGPVYLEFGVDGTAGPPLDMVVILSSTYADLDAAALRMFTDMRFSSNCPGQRFRMMAKFNLHD